MISDLAATGVAAALGGDTIASHFCDLHQFDKIFKYAIGLLVKAADEGQYQQEDEFRKNLRSFAKFLKRPSTWMQLQAAGVKLKIKAKTVKIPKSETRMASEQNLMLSIIRLYPLIVAMFAAWAAESNEFGPFKCETNTDGFVDMMTQDDFEELVQLHAIGLLSQIFITVVQYQKYWTGAFAHILRMLALKAHEDVVTGGVPLMVIELDAIANQSVRNLDSIKEEIDFDDLQALSKKVLEKALEEAKDRCNQEMSPAEMAAAAFDPRVLNLEHIVGEDAAGIKTKIAAAAEDAYVRFSMKQPASMAAAEAGAAARIAQDADAAVDSIPAMPALKRRRSGPSVTIITPPAAPAESSNQLGAAKEEFQRVYTAYKKDFGDWINIPVLQKQIASKLRREWKKDLVEQSDINKIDSYSDADVIQRFIQSGWVPDWVADVLTLDMEGFWRQHHEEVEKYGHCIKLGMIYTAGDASNAAAEAGNSLGKDYLGKRRFNLDPQEAEEGILLLMNKALIAIMKEAYATELAEKSRESASSMLDAFPKPPPPPPPPTQPPASGSDANSESESEEAEAETEYTVDFFVKELSDREKKKVVERRYPRDQWEQMKTKVFVFCKYEGYGKKEDVTAETSNEYKQGMLARYTFYSELLKMQKLEKENNATFKARVARWVPIKY